MQRPLFGDVTNKDLSAINQKGNTSTATIPTATIDVKGATSNNPSGYKGHASKQSWYNTQDGWNGKLA